MITIYNEQDALQLTDPVLRSLVEGHLTTAKENGLESLTCIAIVEPDDDERTFIAELGFSPLRNPLTETTFGDSGFEPYWDWFEVHPGWVELIWTVGDSGFAFIVLLSRAHPQFGPICEAFAYRPNHL